MEKNTVSTELLFENFFFNPHFNDGAHKGTFSLCIYYPKKDQYEITSEIKDIREIDGSVIVETEHSIYNLCGRKIQSLENVKKYLHDENFSSEEFFKTCVPNKMPTIKGWELF